MPQVYSKGSVVLGWLLDCTRSAWSLSSLTLDTWFYLAGAMEQAHPTLQVGPHPFGRVHNRPVTEPTPLLADTCR